MESIETTHESIVTYTLALSVNVCNPILLMYIVKSYYPACADRLPLLYASLKLKVAPFKLTKYPFFYFDRTPNNGPFHKVGLRYVNTNNLVIFINILVKHP